MYQQHAGSATSVEKRKAREWRIRLAEEIRHSKSYFVTLTIDDDNLEILKNELEIKTIKGNENNIATLALRKFLERCRKKTGKYVRGEENQLRRNKNHSGHSPKKPREYTENWSDSRNSND